MLESLQVRNYVLMDSLDTVFPAGLGIITGQTGAGKSILLGALSLALGSKADPSMIGEAADNCMVEAVFDMEGNSSLEEIFDENDLPWNGGSITVRRVIAKSGRSRGFINDEPASVQILSRISSYLIDIHSQHETLLLKDKDYQLRMLDLFAGNANLLSECRSTYSSLQEAKKELSALTARLQHLAMEKDYTEARFNELDKAALKDGELEELEAEHAQLSNAEEIKENLYGASEIFGGDDQRSSMDSMLKEAGKLLSRAGKYVPSALTLSERIDSLRYELEDISSETDALQEGIDVSAERLEAVEQRMSLIYDLLKKHGCRTVQELISIKEALGETLFDSSSLEQKRKELQDSIESLTNKFSEISSKLHSSRVKAAAPFGKNIESDIRSLELDKAVFDVQLLPSAPSSTGTDTVLLRFSSTGKAPVDVAKCASGGELSRIMLCLKAMMARYADMPTMIFDEIDTGVSGSAAAKMGRMICSMGEHMQVFAITHLPQVAANGNAHFLVSKHEDGGRTVSTIERIEGEDRIMEIARMLSGDTITPEAVQNAKSLLAQAGK